MYLRSGLRVRALEVKAYGATGSKQTDILGDMRRIVAEKRHDTTLLFVTDGLTWRHRTSDLARLVGMQNEGEIARIYTQDMAGELRRDLAVLKGFGRCSPVYSQKISLTHGWWLG